MNNQLTVVDRARSLVEAARDQFDDVLIDKSISFEREAGFAVQVLAGNDYAMKIAASNPQSVRNAVVNIAAIGISLNPAKKQAYLVPRDGRICLDISYMGLADLAVASGSVRWVQAVIVRKADSFRLRGIGQEPAHEYDPFATVEERGDIRGVYTVAKTVDGDFLVHPMSAEQVFNIRNRSAAWKAYVSSKKSCPWVTDEDEMVKKTCIKQASKLWPRAEAKDDRLERAINYLNTEGGEGLDLAGDGDVLAADGEVIGKTVVTPQRKSAAQAAPSPAPTPTEPTRTQPKAAEPAQGAASEPASAGQVKWVENNVGRANLTVEQACAKVGIASLQGLSKAKFTELQRVIQGKV